MKTNKTATIKRLTTEPTNVNIKSWAEVGTISVMFLPLSDEKKQLAKAEGIIGKAYTLFAEVSADIQETDRAVIDTLEYDVKGIKKYEGSKAVDHLEILVEERKK